MKIGGEYIENLLVKTMLKKRNLKKKHTYEKVQIHPSLLENGLNIFQFVSNLFGGGGGRDLLLFSFVLNMFPRFSMCSPRVFPIAPGFNPICFAQSPPPLTYMGGPKGEALHLSIESSILGSLHGFNFFFWVMDQSKWFIANKRKKEKKLDL
jgi:hypothetical protein